MVVLFNVLIVSFNGRFVNTELHQGRKQQVVKTWLIFTWKMILILGLGFPPIYLHSRTSTMQDGLENDISGAF